MKKIKITLLSISAFLFSLISCLNGETSYNVHYLTMNNGIVEEKTKRFSFANSTTIGEAFAKIKEDDCYAKNTSITKNANTYNRKDIIYYYIKTEGENKTFVAKDFLNIALCDEESKIDENGFKNFSESPQAKKFSSYSLGAAVPILEQLSGLYISDLYIVYVKQAS